MQHKTVNIKTPLYDHRHLDGPSTQNQCYCVFSNNIKSNPAATDSQLRVMFNVR